METLGVSKTKSTARQPAKRVSIVSVKLVRERSFLFPQRRIKEPSEAAKLFESFLRDADREQLIVLCLDTKFQPTLLNVVSIGTLDCSLVHAREVFKPAILSNAACVILGHNHPSGCVEPSQSDQHMTEHMRNAGRILGIEVLDHLIIGSSGYHYSFRRDGVWGDLTFEQVAS